jgi:hypothetical protein
MVYNETVIHSSEKIASSVNLQGERLSDSIFYMSQTIESSRFYLVNTINTNVNKVLIIVPLCVAGLMLLNHALQSRRERTDADTISKI